MKRAHLLQLSLHMRIMFASCSLLAVGWTSVGEELGASVARR